LRREASEERVEKRWRCEEGEGGLSEGTWSGCNEEEEESETLSSRREGSLVEIDDAVDVVDALGLVHSD